jgi:hypothetical protein
MAPSCAAAEGMSVAVISVCHSVKPEQQGNGASRLQGHACISIHRRTGTTEHTGPLLRLLRRDDAVSACRQEEK